jgi:soluble lytic murein transglycosylase-like protein
MPDTADKLGVRNSFDPAENVHGGAAYLRQLLELYHGDAQKALAAYNAGPGRVEQYKGVPPYRETQAYVARIIREYNRKKRAEQAAAKQLPAKRAIASKKATTTTKKPAAEARRSSTAQPGS